MTRGTAFGELLKRLRLAAGLTQQRLAERAGVSAKAVSGLEQRSDRTPRLETVTRLADALGLDRDDRARLLAAARPDSPASRRQAPDAVAPIVDPVAASTRATWQDWDEAPEVVTLHGRGDELAKLKGWVLDAGARLVVISGMGGIGKTALTVRLARELAPGFDAVYWRSLRNAPPPGEWLADAIHLLSEQELLPAQSEEARLSQLRELLRARRCLLVLDNLETVLQPGESDVRYRAGSQGYGQAIDLLGESAHRSCLLVTSRELPPEVSARAGAPGRVRALRLWGLDAQAGRALLADRGLTGDAATRDALVARYGGNVLALQMVCETIRALFGGEIAAFLAQGESVFGDIRRLLDGQVARLSPAERAVLDWLAIERVPVEFGILVADLGPTTPRATILDALEGLRRRSLLEQGERGATITLHPVVLEHATERLVGRIAEEIVSERPVLLSSHAIVKAQAKEYVRLSQERLLAGSILDRLAARGLQRRIVERRLLALLDGWRSQPSAEQGYGPGNSINLLRTLRGDLRGLDLSHLVIRQAYLAETEAQDASLVESALTDTVMADAFGVPGSVALSHDGASLAVGTSAGAVQLWRMVDRTLVTTLAGHTGSVVRVALSASGDLLACGSEDGVVRVWQTETGQLLTSLHAHTGLIWSVALTRDGSLVASGGGDGAVRLSEATTGRSVATLRGHDGAVYGVALAGDGRLVASGGADGTVRLWEGGTGRPIMTLRDHSGPVYSVALTADGRVLASGSLDGTARLWDTCTGRTVATLRGHEGGVWRVALSPGGHLVASGGGDGSVRIWDAVTSQPLTTLRGHAGAIWSLALTAAGHLLASGGLDGTVRLWEVGAGRPLATLRSATNTVWSVALATDGQLVASAGSDGAVRLWDAGTGRVLATMGGNAGVVRGVALSADRRLLASGGTDGAVRVWEARTGRPLTTLRGHDGVVWSVAIAADGRLVASGGEDGTVRLWETTSTRPGTSLRGHGGAVWSVAVAAEGGLVVSGAEDGTARLWDTRAGRPLVTLAGHRAPVRGVALTADGNLVATGSSDGTVRLWEAGTGRQKAALQHPTGGLYSVALSRDGELLASGGDGVVQLWNARTGQPLAALRGHLGAVWSVALTADGSVVASVSGDGSVHLWHTRDGTRLHALRPDRRFERLNITGLTGLTAAQRDALLMLGAEDRTIQPGA